MTKIKWWQQRPRVRTAESIAKTMRKIGVPEQAVEHHVQGIRAVSRKRREDEVVNGGVPRRSDWRKPGPDHSSGHVGVFRHADGERWVAIAKDGGRIGVFDTKRQAVLAQRNARVGYLTVRG